MGRFIKARLGLERDGAGDNAAIDLRQGHVHGDVAGTQAIQIIAPIIFVRAREDHLNDRYAGPLQGRIRAGAAGFGDGEAGRVKDHARRFLGKDRIHSFGRDGFLQGGDENRQRVQTVFVQTPDDAIHRVQIAGLV